VAKVANVKSNINKCVNVSRLFTLVMILMENRKRFCLSCNIYGIRPRATRATATTKDTTMILTLNCKQSKQFSHWKHFCKQSIWWPRLLQWCHHSSTRLRPTVRSSYIVSTNVDDRRVSAVTTDVVDSQWFIISARLL